MEPWTTSPTGLLRNREGGFLAPSVFARIYQFSEQHVKHLALEKSLKGHQGCVNRLAWNQNGTLLASASDDKKVLLWSYPDTERSPLAVDTQHSANIFGVKFLPCTGDSQIVTGAMDKEVRLHRLDRPPSSIGLRHRPDTNPARMRRHVDASHIVPAAVHTDVYLSHTARVKEVEVEPMNPNMWWSAAEDGTVRQFDSRTSPVGQASYNDANVLVCVREKHEKLELKSLSINKVRPWQLAVGAADQYVRIYDRRMMGTRKMERTLVSPPVLKLAPPHMCLWGRRHRSFYRQTSNCTFVSFGSTGEQVVVTYHGDHAYSFYVQAGGDNALGAAFCGVGPCPYMPGREPEYGSAFPSDGAFLAPVPATPIVQPGNPCGSVGRREKLSRVAEAKKSEGNRSVFERNYSRAVAQYSEAIRAAPTSAQLHALRSGALLDRGWEGDAWWALEDCARALYFDEDNSKAHQRSIGALKALGQFQLALRQGEQYMQRFPQEQREVAPVLDSIRAELAHRRQVKQNRKHQRDALRKRRAQAQARERTNRSEQDFSQYERESAALNARPGVPASAFVSPSDSPTASWGSPPSPPAGSPPPPPPPAASRRPGVSMWGGAPLDIAMPRDSGQRGDQEQASTSGRGAVDQAPTRRLTVDPDFPRAARGHTSNPAARSPSPRPTRRIPLVRPPPPPSGHYSNPSEWTRRTIRPGVPLPPELENLRRPMWARPEGSGGNRLAGARGVNAALTRAALLLDAPPSSRGAGPAPQQQGQTDVAAAAEEESPGQAEARGEAHGGDPMATSGDDNDDAGVNDMDIAEASRAGGGAVGSSSRALQGDPPGPRQRRVAIPGSASGPPGPWPVPSNAGRPPSARGEPRLHPGLRRWTVERQGSADDGAPEPRPAASAAPPLYPAGSLELAIRNLRGRADGDRWEARAGPPRVGVTSDSDDDNPLDTSDGSETDDSGDDEEEGWPRDEGNGAAGMESDRKLSALLSLLWSAGPGRLAMRQRYVGHCNVQTDIKEAIFMGPNDEFVAAGSDCGHVFIYNAATGQPLRMLEADEDVANCVQCHPTLPVLATSGIEHVVDIWSPQMPDLALGEAVREFSVPADTIDKNQERMREGPNYLPSVNPRVLQAITENPGILNLLMTRTRNGAGDEDDEAPSQVGCRVS